MDPRPWAPASAHIGPDTEDLAMLAPTGDPEEDLGAAVLVAHRVGAAACESIARAPLPDEYRMIEALASARAALAPTLVDVVSKCVSSERPEVYADLLARDLFDAGESGALAVYRACVAKGVAPPLAVQRAGFVYGVPREELGRYLGVASDPKSHPIAIADSADRVVAKWASGVVREELEPTKINKRTLTEYNATTVGQEHPKGERGRFTRVMERPPGVTTTAPAAGEVAGRPVGLLARYRRAGGGGQAAPEVATEPAVAAPVTVAEPPPPVREVREARGTRQTRQTRQARSEVQANVQSNVASSLDSNVTALVGSRVEANLQAQMKAHTGEFAGLNLNSDVSVDDDEEYGQIPGNLPLAWAMHANQADELYYQGEGPADRKHVVMGRLMDAMRDRPLKQWHDPKHHSEMRHAADLVSGIDVKTKKISAWELSVAGIDTAKGRPKDIAQRVREYAEESGYLDELAHNPITNRLDLEMLADQSVAPSADPGGDWYVIQHVDYQRDDLYQEGQTTPESKRPLAAEFVILDTLGRIKGNVRGGPQAVDESGKPLIGNYTQIYDLDPSQKVVIQAPRRVWKQVTDTSGYYVNRYSIRSQGPDSDVGKAVLAATRSDAPWRTEQRNAQGRWTSRGLLAAVREEPEEKLVVPAEAPPLPIRETRAARGTRATRSARTTVEANVGAGVGSEVSAHVLPRLDAQTASTVQAAMDELVDEGLIPEHEVQTGFPMTLDDRAVHKLMTMRQLEKFFKRHLPNRFVNDVVNQNYDLSRAAGMELLENHLDMTGDQINEKMKWNVANDPGTQRLRQIPTLRARIGPRDKEKMRLHLQKMHSFLVAHPQVHYLQMSRLTDDPSSIAVYANSRPVADQVLIYMPDDFNPDAPITLRYLGKATQTELNRGRWVPDDEQTMSDVPVEVYRMEKSLYQVQQ